MKIEKFQAMGSQILIALDTDDNRITEKISQAQGMFESWEQILSRFRSSSELTQLNQHSGQAFHVSEVLWEVLELSEKAEMETDGLITPLMLNALEAAGYDRTFEALRLEAANLLWQSMSSLPKDESRLILDKERHMVTLPPGKRVDLGGIAKGWAAQRAMLFLQDYAPTLVDAGGDIAISGPKTDTTAWPVGVANPYDADNDLDLVMLSGGGIATSGKDFRRWMRNDRWMHHIIDPRTSEPAESDLICATVIGNEVMEAEAAAKAALILGSENAVSWFNDRPALSYLLVLDNGQSLLSQNYREYQWNESWNLIKTQA